MGWIALAAMAPAIVWLWYFHRFDKRPEPIGLVAIVFVAGGLAVFPAILIERRLMPFFPPLDPDQDFSKLLLSATVIAGGVEELIKFLVVLAVFLFHHDFDEPVDGLVYAVTVAMGFTAAENYVAYLTRFEAYRMLSPPGHAMFSVFWGYELGRRLHRPALAGWLAVGVGLVLSILAHGLWDAIAFRRLGPHPPFWFPYVVFGLAVFLFWRLESRLRLLSASSPLDGRPASSPQSP